MGSDRVVAPAGPIRWTVIATSAIGAVVVFGAGLPIVRLANVVVVGLDIVAWAFVHAVTGYLVHRLPLRRFTGDGWLWQQRRWERGGSTYSGLLRIGRWQRHLPEAGALFAGGFDKGHLRGRSTPFLQRYVAETRRAELGHLMAIVPAPLFAFWNPLAVAPLMVLYALGANLPCILSMRYNRIRLTRILARRSVREERRDE